MTKIIAISNQKGGVGKTTTAVNLAACLAALEKTVLLVDMDPQGNASQGVGIHEIQDEDVYDALSWRDEEIPETTWLKSLIKDSSIPYLRVLPASPSLASIEFELVNSFSRERRLQRILEVIAGDYEYVILDCPPSLGLLTINVLTAAHSVVIPIQCEYYALQGVAELLNTVRMVQKVLNPELKIEGALLTMYDSRLSLSKQVVDEVRATFTGRVFKTMIPRNVKLSEAPSHGKPIILYDILCVGSQKYMDLAEEILVQEAKGG